MATHGTIHVGGHSYVWTAHPAQEGLAISLRLTSSALVGVARGIGAAAGSGSMADAIGSVADAVAGLLAAPDAADLVRRILAHTTRDGEPLSRADVFASAFSGNYGDLYEVVVEVAAGNGFLPARATWIALASKAGISMDALSSPTPSA
jgi:hypothetical protein